MGAGLGSRPGGWKPKDPSTQSITMNPLGRLLLAFFAFACLGHPAAWAQSSSATFNPVNPVTDTGGLLIHDDGTNLMGYSSSTRRWIGLGPSGTVLVDSGKWMALVQRPNGQRVFFVGRTGQLIPHVELASDIVNVTFAGVSDEVGCMVYETTSGGRRLFCVSAGGPAYWNLSNASVPLLTRTTVVMSDQVGSDMFYLGYSARTGTVEVGPIEPAGGRSLVGTGNVGLVISSNKLNSFSGVLGTWNQIDRPASWTVDENVALALTQPSGGDSSFLAYSAYDGTWVEGPRFDPLATPYATTVGNHWIAVELDGRDWYAIGSRPHGEWREFSVTGATLHASESGFGLRFDATGAAFFSGVERGEWDSGTLSGSGSVVPEVSKHSVLFRRGNRSRRYNPLRDAILSSFNHGGSGGATATALGGTGALFRNSAGELFAQGWHQTSLVPSPDAPNPNSVLVAGETLLASVDPTDNDAVRVFDPHKHAWIDELHAGSPATVETEGNILCVSGPAGVFVYSVVSGAWRQFSDPSLQPITTGAFLSEEFVWVAQNGYLTATPGTADVNVWYAFPAAPDFHVYGDPSNLFPSRFEATIAGRSGSLALNFYDTARLSAGIPLGGVVSGILWIAAPVLIDSFAVPSGPAMRWSVPLPDGGAGYELYWHQSAFSSTGPSPFELSENAQPLLLY